MQKGSPLGRKLSRESRVLGATQYATYKQKAPTTTLERVKRQVPSKRHILFQLSTLETWCFSTEVGWMRPRNKLLRLDYTASGGGLQWANGAKVAALLIWNADFGMMVGRFDRRRGMERVQ